MIISVNWLKKLVPIERSIDELTTLIGSRLVEIESVVELGPQYKDVIVVQVHDVFPHPNADRLHIVMIDDGGVSKTAQRAAGGYVQVVCGAPNVREGMLAAWVPPGATVPSTFYDPEPFVLDTRPLRGMKSNGMLASAKELGIGDNHDGILEVDKPAQVGASFAELYELNDHLLDIENKSLTHRPDAFGLIGFARELAAIQGVEFITPKWFTMLEPVLADKIESSLEAPTVTITDKTLSARYQAVVLEHVDAKRQSPLQIQSYLARVGVRPISVVVDTTNYLMLLTGQPLHAFDYDAFVATSSTKKPTITVRKSQQGELLNLLDGRTITLSDDDIIIAAGETPVALAGAMGGAATEIVPETKNVLLEVATFDLYSLRATQMRHGIFSEAMTRFTKGQPATITAPVMASAIRMLTDLAGGQRVSDIIEQYPGQQQPLIISLSVDQCNKVLGTHYHSETILAVLKNSGFTVDASSKTLQITPPYWRTDIHVTEDVIEEIGRILGFDTIIPSLPIRESYAVRPTAFETYKEKLRARLLQAGTNEVLTYSFVHGNILEQAGQDVRNAFRVTNALSPELQYYRLSLMPSLLAKVHANSKQGFDSFALYEINKTHQKGQMDHHEPNVPAEQTSLALTLTASDKSAADRGSGFYQAKYMLKHVFSGQHLEYQPYSSAKTPRDTPFQPGRSAHVVIGDVIVGIVGEYTASVREAYKLPRYAAGFEVDLQAAFAFDTLTQPYTPPYRFQGTEKDVCIQVQPDQSYASVQAIVEAALHDSPLDWTIEPVDIYQPADGAYKNITFRLHLTDPAKTITQKDTKNALEAIAQAVKKTIDAHIV